MHPSTPSGRRRLTTGVLAATGLAFGVGGLAQSPARAATGHVVINEVFGGGGNTGAPFANDFVELYNPTPASVDLTGMQLRYWSASGVLGNACTLTGQVAPGGHFLVQEAKGTGTAPALPTPDATCTGALSATNGSVELVQGDATVDLVGFGTASRVEQTGAPAPSNSTSISRTNGVDTDDNAADFIIATPGPQDAASDGSSPTPTTTPDPTPGPTPGGPATITPIAAIQGTGASTPLAGQSVTTVGVVTASYPTGGFNGFYVQTPGSGGTAKKAGDASDGVFVYTGSAPTVKVGECYKITGVPAEYNGLTQITGPTLAPASDCAPVTPTDLAALPATDEAKEPYEGMLVRPRGSFTITNNYAVNQYGQLGLAAGDEPLWTPTDRVAPSEAAAFEAEQQKKYITLDDGSSWDYLRNATAQNSPVPYLSQATPVRTGSHVTFTQPVILDHRFQWNLQPTSQVVGATSSAIPVSTENDRPTSAPKVGGELKLGSMNVLNYFTDLGQDEAGCKAYDDIHGTPVTADDCTVRGAYTPAALTDQQAKIVSALAGLDADVVGLMEVENSARFGHDRDAALATLVDALNKKVGAGTYAYVPSPKVLPAIEDVIRPAFIYKVAKVKPVDASALLDTPAFANARQSLGQRFESLGTGRQFVVVANHFKSKGSGVDDGTGQGLSEPSREAQATDAVNWVQQTWPGQPVFMVGDFNAYTHETPVQIIQKAGFTDLVRQFSPGSTSYQYGGRLGSLDHAFANQQALALVTGADDYSVNDDESVAFEYSRRNYNVEDLYAANPFASSDHDPVLVGISDTRALPVLTPYQNCTSFGVKVSGAQPGDRLRVDGHWNGQAQTTTVPLTDAGWWSGAKPSWTDATAVVVRNGVAIESTRVSLQQTAECTPVITASAAATSFGFQGAPLQPGDRLRIDGHWNGSAQTTTVTLTSAGWWSGTKPGWTDATAVVIRGGEALEQSRVRITNPGR